MCAAESMARGGCAPAWRVEPGDGGLHTWLWSESVVEVWELRGQEGRQDTQPTARSAFAPPGVQLVFAAGEEEAEDGTQKQIPNTVWGLGSRADTKTDPQYDPQYDPQHDPKYALLTARGAFAPLAAQAATSPVGRPRTPQSSSHCVFYLDTRSPLPPLPPRSVNPLATNTTPHHTTALAFHPIRTPTAGQRGREALNDILDMYIELRRIFFYKTFQSY